MRVAGHERFNRPLTRVEPIVIGMVTGSVGGMGAFMAAQIGLVPAPLDGRHAASLILIAGAYTHFLFRDIRKSLTAMIVALAAGFLTLVLAWSAPLWILPYPPGARETLLPMLLQRALVQALSSYFVLFLMGYLVSLTIDGYFD